MKKTALWIFFILFTGYAAIIVYFINQEEALIFGVHQSRLPLVQPPVNLNLKYIPLRFENDDGDVLSGWMIQSKNDSTASQWILFCHGNASNISYSDYFPRYDVFTSIGCNVLTFDYRGFGESTGKPSEEGLNNDALSAFRFLADSLKIPINRIFIYGFSLGTAPAIDLATRIQAAGLIIEAGYPSMPEVAKELYPFLPMKLIMKNKFRSIDKIEKVMIPTLFFHSVEDEWIPIEMGRLLYEKALPPKSFFEMRGPHDSAPMDSMELYNEKLSEFVNKNSL